MYRNQKLTRLSVNAKNKGTVIFRHNLRCIHGIQGIVYKVSGNSYKGFRRQVYIIRIKNHIFFKDEFYITFRSTGNFSYQKGRKRRIVYGMHYPGNSFLLDDRNIFNVGNSPVIFTNLDKTQNYMQFISKIVIIGSHRIYQELGAFKIFGKRVEFFFYFPEKYSRKEKLNHNCNNCNYQKEAYSSNCYRFDGGLQTNSHYKTFVNSIIINSRIGTTLWARRSYIIFCIIAQLVAVKIRVFSIVLGVYKFVMCVINTIIVYIYN